ncbi:MAG: spherulation-specific family 4 protein [Planctomycetota bacterium]
MQSALLLFLAAFPRASVQAVNPAGAHTPVRVESRAPKLRVLVPAYFYPVAGSPWSRMNAAAVAHPDRIVAIGNPFNGPGTTLDTTYLATFQSFRASGGKLIGYVYTSYGARPIADVKADVDTWRAWYPIDGVFVDEMDNVPGAHESYYRALYDYVRTQLADALIIGNPGTSTVPSYLSHQGAPVASALCIYESSGAALTWSADPWVLARDRRHFAALPYATPAASWQAAVDHAWQQNCGFVYATDDALPNPWDTLPPYFEAMAGYVDATY